MDTRKQSISILLPPTSSSAHQQPPIQQPSPSSTGPQFPPSRNSPRHAQSSLQQLHSSESDFLSLPALQSTSQLEILMDQDGSIKQSEQQPSSSASASPILRGSPGTAASPPMTATTSDSSSQQQQAPHASPSHTHHPTVDISLVGRQSHMTSIRSFRGKQSISSNRQGSVRRAADQRSQTFAIPAQSLTSPPANVGLSLPFNDDGIVSPDRASSPIQGTASSSSSATSPPLPPKGNITNITEAMRVVHGSQQPQGSSVNEAQQQVGAMFALFGSLERKVRLQEVAEVFRKHQTTLEPFLKAILKIDNVFPPDINLVNFLNDPSQAPDDQFFEFPMVSWPITTIFLVSCFFVTATKVGYSQLYSALQQGGVLTLGKGVFAALSVAESRNEEELIRNTSRHYRAAFCVGIAYQKKQSEVAEITRNCPRGGFSVLVVNIAISTLQLLIDEVNVVDVQTQTDSIPLSEVQISRVVSQRSAVVVGHPLDLMRLDVLIVKFAQHNGVKVHKDFLPTPVPENSPFYNQGLQYEVCQLWVDMGFFIEGSDLCLPCFSPEHGGELNQSCNLIMEIAGIVTCVPQDLTYSLQNLRNGDVLLDFSPSTMRIAKMIAWTRRNITCLAEPSDRVEESILPSPRRSAKGSLVCETFAKCATLNEVMTSLMWDMRPPGARIASLSTSFIDLKLLIDLDTVAIPTPHTAPAGGVNAFDTCRSAELSITSFPSSHRGSAITVGSPTAPNIPTILSPRGGALSPPLNPRALMNTSLSHFAGAHTGGAGTMFAATDKPSTIIKTQTIPAGRLVVIGSSINKQVINVYEVAPLIRYLEKQHRCVLTKGAVEFADRLSKATKIEFPAYTLLLCPTVFQLLEFWDGLEFVASLRREADQRHRGPSDNAIREALHGVTMDGGRDAPPGIQDAATKRNKHLKRAMEFIYGGGYIPTPPGLGANGSGRPAALNAPLNSSVK